MILVNEDIVARSDNTEVEFLFESHAKTFVEHGDAFFFIGEEEDFRH